MIRYFVDHPTIANLLMIAFLAVGAVTASTLQRATFPRIEADTVQITVRYPGATTESVEETICRRIEDAVDRVDGVSELQCEARFGVATATVEMVEGGVLDRFFADIKTEVDAIDTFPDLVEAPVIRQLGRTDFVTSVAVTGPQRRQDLKDYAEQVKDLMHAFGGIPQTEIRGFSDRQLRIEIPDAVVRKYGLSVEDLARTIERQNVEIPAGSIETEDGDILLRFTDRRRAVDTLRDLIVITSPDGGEIPLGQIARIDDRFENEEVRIEFNGRPAALIDVMKSETDDTLTVIDRVRAFIAEEGARAPPGVAFTIVDDRSSIVRDRLLLLVKNGVQGLALVFLAMWLFFGLRYSFWIAMGLPVAFMGGIAAMAVLGYSLNMMTMVGLLIVVGILMDDAIVISENIAAKREQGLSPTDAAKQGALEVMPGVFSSFLTTVLIFGSLAFLKGDIGQFLRVVPVVMMAVLIASLIEAFLILPNHLAHAMHHRTRQGRIQAAADRAVDWVRDKVVGRLCERLVGVRYLTAGFAFSALILAVTAMAGGVLKFTPFPELDGDTLEARILTPQGTPLARTRAIVDRIDRAVDRINDRLTPDQPDGADLVRTRTVRFNENADAYETGPHVATVSIDLLPSEVRTIDNETFFALWREEVGDVPDVISLKFTEPAIGPAGRAIDIRLTGADLDALKVASRDLQAWLNRYWGVVNVLDDLRLGKPELRIRINEEGVALGLRAEDIAGQIRSAFFGATVDEIQVAAEMYEIDVRLAGDDRGQLSTLDDFVIASPDGALIPLSSIASIEQGRGFARINRIDRRRAVSVQGDVDTRLANASEVIADTAARFLPGFLERYPGVSFEIAGQNEETATTRQSMLIGFALGLVGVFLVLSFQFRSYVEPVVVMIVIPFSFIGAVSGHLIMGLDFTMPSMLGFAALSGVVVNDSILLVNRIKAHHSPGGGVAEAAPKAAKARFRAIFLTSLTTILGLLPLLLETSLQAQILIPLVTSLSFGLMASTLLVLFVVPAFYAILDDFGLTTLAAERRALAAAGAPQPAE